ncbi:hypothetical protein MKW92_036488 [Papaver armeniacum]|nr:hypothetical protein MKW92_036488 [Papaver armeniacum]
MGAHNPSVTPEQFSTSQLWIQNGPKEQINSIETGWAADGYKRTGCFNMFCPGFVQVHSSITFGELLEPVSVYNKKLYSIPVMVYRAPISGNWWLRFRREVIGYWPKELFTHLAHNASIIRYGGIAGAVSKSPSPPMGNGQLPIYKDSDIEKSGFMREMKVYNETGDTIYFDYTKTQTKQDARRDCYDLNYYFSERDKWNCIKYGGPGGSSCL